MTKLRVGIVGYGRIGNEHAGWLARSNDCAVAGVFDPTPARRSVAAAAGLATTDALGELLDDPAIDAVLIATPTSMHHDHALAAIAAGKHVMVEKPIAIDLPQAMAVRDGAASAGVVLSVFHCRRWDADFLTVQAAVASGVLGRLINVESRLGQFASCVGPAAREYRPGWRNEGAFGGGGLYDWG
ncbi:MAG TPA: Gfo/Idh/MocA family oxidoreductase, partial [Tepidisphaeraceae bacterium]